MYAVIFETEYQTRILFEGTYDQCVQYRIDNPEICDDCTFVQELETA